jgi:hypothetical protein
MIKKRVLLLAVSCREGGLCPGGIDLDNESQWIRIVKDDGRGGSVQGVDIDFARPLDVIEFEGRPMPQGKQKENWVIDNCSCKKKGKASLKNGNGTDKEILDYVYEKYSYHGFWGSYRSYLNEEEFERVTEPSESIMKVSNVRIYKNNFDKAKIDFDWNGCSLCGISMTDQDFYGMISNGEVDFKDAYIVVSIPKSIGEWVNPNTGERQAYKFVSRVFGFTLKRRLYDDTNLTSKNNLPF